MENRQRNRLNLRVTLLITLVLFLMMICAGVASSYLGYIMGQEALKAVTQPEVNSGDAANQKRPVGGNYKGLKIINEKEILVEVYNRINGKNRQRNLDRSSSKKTDLVDYQQQSKSVDSKSFPISQQSQGVTLKVSNAKFQGNSLLLDLNLTNESDRSVRFLYSFLDVRDDNNRPLSAITDGLPATIPGNSETFKGTLRIPTVLLNDTKTISLTLTDYPQQNLELKLQQIPIAR